MEEDKKSETPFLTFIITFLSVIAIVILAFFYYYFTTLPVPNTPKESAPAKNLPEAVKPAQKAENFLTEVINFMPPENLPAEIKDGFCTVNSVAQPFRQDAYKCEADDSVYDPCFSTALSDVVYCQMNPLSSAQIFLIKLAKPLPPLAVLKNAQDNWAWFVELRDGTYCSPYTGARPLFQGQAAYYGCKSNVKGEQVVLTGELNKGPVWTAKKTVLVKDGQAWSIKSSEDSEIKTVWK